MIVRTLALIRKEFLHILRDRRTLGVMFVMPIVQLMLMGYAATTDIEHLRTAILDGDKSPASRELVDAYRASNYFDIAFYVESEQQLEYLVDSGQVRAGLIIPAGYGQALTTGDRAQVAFVIDGSDPSVASTVFAASQSVGQAQSMRIIERTIGIDPDDMPGVQVRPRVWYNPEMKSANFMIPGIMGMILYFQSSLFTAMAIVRERELGTIEQLIVTPIKPLELIIGKVIPYVFIAFFNVLEVLAIGVFWFGVPVRGSLGLLLGLSALFLLSSLGIGIFISSVANTQQEAMLLTFLTMFPSIFLGGFFFPIEAMPDWLRVITYVIPLRYMLVIIRGIILKGVGLQILRQEVIALSIFGVVIMLLATARFRKKLE
ncbi:MAG: ABC transporter permease [Anaerolineales bacterium]|nr:MAG: ABC transporter permease [Anaerolineales bacterium]